MRRFLLAQLTRLCVGLSAGLLLGAQAAYGAPPAQLPQAGAVVLYEQMDSPSTQAITSQNFEADLDQFDRQVADDFAVPSGEVWTITSVEVLGKYDGLGSRTVNSVNVQFYTNSSDNLPSGLLYSGTFSPTGGLNDGNFVLTLNPPAIILPGRAWVSIQANMNFNPERRQWQWIERTAQNGSAAAVRRVNPNTDCPNTWATFAASPCLVGEIHDPDLLFRLNGTTAPAVQVFLPLIRR
jgi:hypothetical protein